MQTLDELKLEMINIINTIELYNDNKLNLSELEIKELSSKKFDLLSSYFKQSYSENVLPLAKH